MSRPRVAAARAHRRPSTLGVAVVTGGTRGLGEAIACALRDAGHDVVITGTSDAGPTPAGCELVACDFTDDRAVDRLARTLGELEPRVLVNNAGINAIGPLETYDPAEFARLQQVNVTAPFRLCQAVVPAMRRNRFGRIVNITSILGIVSKPGRSAYSASKSALAGLTRALALEVAADNVLVNCVAPGFVETDLTRRVLGEAGIAATVPQIPIGRLARPDEIARCVRFLVSDENTYLTGQELVVDGGFTCA